MTDTVTVPREVLELLDRVMRDADVSFYHPDRQTLHKLLAATTKAECDTCEGRGVVGGFAGPESGYQDDVCPLCHPESQKGEPVAVLTGITLEGTQGDPAGMMTVKAELSDGRQITLIKSNGNNIYHWASTCNLPVANPAPSSELLEAAVSLQAARASHSENPTQANAMAVCEASKNLDRAIAKHKGPQS